jgi:hypothetical protein
MLVEIATIAQARQCIPFAVEAQTVVCLAYPRERPDERGTNAGHEQCRRDDELLPQALFVHLGRLQRIVTA